ncbi:MAG TPA: TonB-dependent receptor [Bryobacteraceae bacterium]|nr:TonB-dependent receptor [Bryobacteraceae bacterium]
MRQITSLFIASAMGTVLLMNVPSQAQTTYGKIVGNARDSSDSIVAGVAVTVINEATGERSVQSTNDQGAYAFNALYPGTYTVQAEHTGFRPIHIQHITLQVNQTARFDLVLEVGQVSESVNVTAAVPVLATDTSDVGQVITTRQIVDLPLNGRNFLQLAALTNGVVLSGTTESGGPNFLSEGGRPTQNSFLIDGVETRIQREGRYGLNLSVDAIEEFKIMQNSYSAEYGRGTTIVNAAIRSGTNALHGSVFEFLRNDKLDARNAFDLTGRKPPLRQNQFGASLGGPIRRDKLFYFANYEGQRVRRGASRFTSVPTPAMLAGDLRGMATAIDPETGAPFPDNRIPAARISQFAKAAIPYFPAPTSSALINLNYQAVLSNPTDMNQGTGRLDYILSTNDRLSGHYTAFDYRNVNVGTLPFSGTQGFSRVKNVAAEHVHNFSPRLLNTFRFGWVYTDTYTGPDQLLDKDVTREFGLKNLSPEPQAYAPPGINIQGFGSIGSQSWIPNGAVDNNTQFVEQLVYTRGRHSFKAGADVRRLRYDDLGYAIQNGTYGFANQYTGNAVADFLLGIPQTAYAHRSGGKGFSFKTSNTEYSFYGQDDIKLSRNLTVNAGLRYEFVQWPQEANNEFSVWNFEKGRLDFAGKELSRRIAPTDKNNLAPRLGFAYTPFKKTVVRAAGGFTYGNFRQWEVALFHFSPPFVYENLDSNDFPKPRFTTSTLWPAPEPLDRVDFRTVTVNYQSPDKVLPLTYQWTFGIQQELMRNLLFEVGYVGNRSVRQPNRWDANPARQDADLSRPTPIQSRRPYQNVGFVSGNTSMAWSTYNALNLRVERRYSSGLSLLGAYTWSKAMAIRSFDNFTVMDIDNMRTNYGPANDFTHNAVISYIYDLPFGTGKAILGDIPGVLNQIVGGWQINGITTFRSGAALSLSSPVSNNRGNRAGNRPDRLADGNLPNSERKVEKWFDTAAFKDPRLGTYGNAGEGILRGPGLVNWDVSLFKNFRIVENKTLQFRWEMFNAFNNVNLGNPSTNTGDARFGRISSASTAREMQAGLKLLF